MVDARLDTGTKTVKLTVVDSINTGAGFIPVPPKKYLELSSDGSVPAQKKAITTLAKAIDDIEIRNGDQDVNLGFGSNPAKKAKLELLLGANWESRLTEIREELKISRTDPDKGLLYSTTDKVRIWLPATLVAGNTEFSSYVVNGKKLLELNVSNTTEKEAALVKLALIMLEVKENNKGKDVDLGIGNGNVERLLGNHVERELARRVGALEYKKLNEAKAAANKDPLSEMGVSQTEKDRDGFFISLMEKLGVTYNPDGTVKEIKTDIKGVQSTPELQGVLNKHMGTAATEDRRSVFTKSQINAIKNALDGDAADPKRKKNDPVLKTYFDSLNPPRFTDINDPGRIYVKTVGTEAEFTISTKGMNPTEAIGLRDKIITAGYPNASFNAGLNEVAVITIGKDKTAKLVDFLDKERRSLVTGKPLDFDPADQIRRKLGEDSKAKDGRVDVASNVSAPVSILEGSKEKGGLAAVAGEKVWSAANVGKAGVTLFLITAAILCTPTGAGVAAGLTLAAAAAILGGETYLSAYSGYKKEKGIDVASSTSQSQGLFTGNNKNLMITAGVGIGLAIAIACVTGGTGAALVPAMITGISNALPWASTIAAVTGGTALAGVAASRAKESGFVR